MGYTHYWSFDGDPETFGRTLLDAKSIIDATDISICGGLGSGEPELGEGLLRFNGDASRDEDYETFALNPAGGSDFCKTREDSPYDAVVTAVLIRLAQHGGDHVSVSSDGLWSEWEAGRAIVAEVFGDCPTRSILPE